MTPIFKRYLFKNMIFGGILLLFLLISAKTHMNAAEKAINKVNELIVENNIDKDFFKDKANENFFSDFIYTLNECGGVGINLISNEEGAAIPELRDTANAAASENASEMSALGFACAIAFGIYAFVFERRKNTSSFVGALPYKRERMFFEKWLAGLIVLAAIFAVDYIFTGLWLHKILPIIESLDKRLLAAEYEVVSGFGEESLNFGRMMWSLFLSVTVLHTFMMFVQNLFGKPVYAALTVAGAGVGFFIAVRAADVFCNNYEFDGISIIGSKFFEKAEDMILNTPVFTLAALVCIVIFLVCGLLLSGKVRLENASGVFMFKPVKYLVYTVMMFEGALVFYDFATGACGLSSGSLLTGLLYLALGAVITLLALNKLFTLEVEI